MVKIVKRRAKALIIALCIAAGICMMPHAAYAEDVNPNAKIVYIYLTEEAGLGHAAACGILANMQLESGFIPTIWDPSGVSFGLCQWLGARYHTLRSWCAEHGLSSDSALGQAAYTVYELKSVYPGVLSVLENTPDTAQGAYNAARYFCIYFEAPANAAAKGAQRGNVAANEWFPKQIVVRKNTDGSVKMAVEGSPVSEDLDKLHTDDAEDQEESEMISKDEDEESGASAEKVRLVSIKQTGNTAKVEKMHH